MKRYFPVTLLASAIIAGCASTSITSNDVEKAYQSINSEQLAEHIKVLASDEFGGRAPSSKGEELTLAYLTEQFKALGFEPGNGDSFLQEVPLVSLEADSNMVLTIGGKDYQYKKDMVMGSSRISAKESIKDSELVFVGYGVNAPEYNWNDYEGLDVKGKTVVMLVNDPGFATKNPDLFTGDAMTYYGRWTYKYEEASRQGAAGAIIIHETAPASYPWSVVENSWSGEQFGFQKENNNMDRVAVEGWVTTDVAKELFSKAGLDFDTMKANAAKGAYHVDMGDLTASVEVNNTIKKSISYNFIATLPGSEKPDEHIIYSAHWDHLGTDKTRKGDQIYNGAHDNATGTAGLIEVAEAFASLPEHPSRSMTFLAVTAEEQGLLGSKYYAANPVIPASQTVANINMDSLNLLGKVKDISVVGIGKSEMDSLLETAAKAQGRTVSGDPKPSSGGYYRSDHFAFANMGVPAMYAGGGSEALDEETANYRKRMSLVLRGCYHQPCDRYRDEWDLSGAVQDLQLFYQVGFDISERKEWPKWNATSEFQRQ
ncbi:M28 family peptidase [Pseudoalteromonas sp. MEBiC 03607]|jgi:Zn-dependent M28 family amino/carboxypeptidase|uniref:M28 family metallopeptidase n=1 Tax=unclassified Pseudoalteromonas TaxID=194690 RepID=UPI000C4EDCAD|nr:MULTISPECIES: M28 family metallopeptidase [unclassified Pseudoalteromonas]MBU76645.1 peptidase M28 [Pseudoalteromonadaceae bacterium]MCF2899554.1 M28 family metallopeptidase [Pseudoalteromonas sp. OFAV1]MCO7249850.1 M28 family metallopeptidase [Pseudoalteromonas sp. Ps84H-4]TGV20503.1 M28 family peptidase [Pseudoalteromonas sp. MEBiC 03607]TMO46569.1 peptidase M28 [Pseudoalteromonas sp. S4389]|tara:strand:+ start:765 stop:2390 length:1626 start_codon:yes stop_codon:yes gene_type:complete